MTIVETAVSMPDQFSTLVSLITLANGAVNGPEGTPFVVDMLSSKEGTKWAGTKYTVFAPTNDAFAKVPAHVVKFLQANPEALLKVLQYHVLGMEAKSSDVLAMIKADHEKGTPTHGVETANGQKLFVESNDSNEIWVGNDKYGKNKVTMADVACDNGVIHVVDTVLIPEDIDLATIPME